MAMRGYERDEYEDLDEYEDDGEEEEEEEGQEDGYEEPQQPTQDELEYLGLRERLKESIRKQMKKESANSGSRDKVNYYRKDNYGSFFGPSQPVVAQRVIQESKSLLENPDLAARISKGNHARSNSSVSSSGKPKVQSSNLPKILNPSKKKVEMIKNTRDYSFLLSENAEVPASTKSPSFRNISAPKTDAQSAGQPLQRSKQVVNDRDRREVVNGVDRRQMVNSNSQSRPKAGMEKVGSVSKLSIESKKQFCSISGRGPGRPLGGPKVGVPSKSPVSATVRVKQPPVKNSIVGANKPNHLSVQSSVQKPNSSHFRPGPHRPSSSHSQLSKNASLQRKEHQEISKLKVMSRQALPPSKEQLKRPTPKLAPRGTLANERAKPKPKWQQHYDDDDDPDGDNAISMIRQMFGYNPNKFRDDDDDSDMEANFDDILREEKRSALIARKEDEEELRLIEEEERRERMRLAKKRKMRH